MAQSAATRLTHQRAKLKLDLRPDLTGCGHWHRMQQYAMINWMLEDCRVVTTAQLERYGLLEASREMQRKGRLRGIKETWQMVADQASSRRDVIAVVADPRWLQVHMRTRKHWAIIGELWMSMRLRPGESWRLEDGRGARGERRPDAVIQGWFGNSAVEADSGYKPADVMDKLVAYAQAGYAELIWIATSEVRVAQVAQWVDELVAADRWPALQYYEIRHGNPSWIKDPLTRGARSHKVLYITRDLLTDRDLPGALPEAEPEVLTPADRLVWFREGSDLEIYVDDEYFEDDDHAPLDDLASDAHAAQLEGCDVADQGAATS